MVVGVVSLWLDLIVVVGSRILALDLCDGVVGLFGHIIMMMVVKRVVV